MTRKLVTVVACMLMFASTALAQTDFRESLRLVFPATVSVTTESTGQAAAGQRVLRRQIPGSQLIDNLLDDDLSRSGFAVGADLVVTQIASNVDQVTIKTAAGKELSGNVVIRDLVTGLTIVKVQGAQFVSLVVGAGAPDPGLPIVVTRLNTAGASQAVSGMIASGPTTADAQLGFTQYLSAPLNRHHAGAPVVDANGVVVGVVGIGNQGTLLCLSTQQVVAMIDKAASETSTDSKRGLIGIQFAGESDPVVTAISEDTPAEEAGLKAGDRITRVADYQIGTAMEVLAAVAMSRAGDDVPISVQRGEETLELVVKLGDHPQQKFVASSAAADEMARQVWQLRRGHLVPLQGDNVPGVPLNVPELLENMPNQNFLLPVLPNQLEGFPVERSDLEDSLRKLKSEQRDHANQIEELQKKLRDLQDP